MKLAISALLGLSLAASAAGAALAATEIQWWHAMTGANNEVVETLSKEFNDSQADYKIVPVFKGTYPETLNAGIAAFRAGQPPHIIQVFDVGTGVMMGAEGAIKPVADVMEKGGSGLRQEPVSARHRRLLLEARRHDAVLPLQQLLARSSTTTRTSSRKPGSTSNNPPKTWPEVWDAAQQDRRLRRGALRLSPPPGSPGSTSKISPPGTTYPMRTKENGLAGPDVELKINSPVFVKHFQDTRRPRQGRRVPLRRPHLGGQAAVPFRRVRHLSRNSSGGLGDIVKSGMNYGTGTLPYEPTAEGAPQNTIPGGASLWVFAGKSDEEYKGVAAFFNFLSQTDIQVAAAPGLRLPAGNAGGLRGDQGSRASTRRTLAARIPIKQMMGKAPTENSKRRARSSTCRRCATSRTRSTRRCWPASRPRSRRSTRRSRAATRRSSRRSGSNGAMRACLSRHPRCRDCRALARQSHSASVTKLRLARASSGHDDSGEAMTAALRAAP